LFGHYKSNRTVQEQQTLFSNISISNILSNNNRSSPTRHYIIFTDSLSDINNITNTYNPSDIGLHIQNKIYTLQYHNNFKIKLFWIPGPSKIKENELADLASKTAITSPLSKSSQIISSSDIRTLITKKCQQTGHQRWTSYYTKLNFIKHNTVSWTFPIEIHRKFEVIITRLRSGHTKISHSFLMAKEEPPNVHNLQWPSHHQSH